MAIKAENWRGKKIIVAREKGRIVSRRKWARNFNLQRAKELFKKNNTLWENRRTEKLTKVIEVVDESPILRKPSRSTTDKIQFFFNVYDKENDIRVTARSMQHDLSDPKSDMVKEAEANFFSRYAHARGEQYDEEIGRKLFNSLPKNKRVLKSGYVYYRKA